MLQYPQQLRSSTGLTFSIRQMTVADLDQVQEIDREAFPTQWPAPNYRQELNNKMAHYIVLCDDTRRTGQPPPPPPPPPRPSFFRRLLPWRTSRHTRLRPDPTGDYIVGFSGIWTIVDEAHITNIAVRTAYQGRGLGEYLLVATFDLAADLRTSFLTLEVRVSNTIAQRLYAKYGFTERGIRKAYYLDNREDAYIMTTDDIRTNESKRKLAELREKLKARLKE
jgi:ribosomal-protein-alanine N-acetyltransferase